MAQLRASAACTSVVAPTALKRIVRVRSANAPPPFDGSGIPKSVLNQGKPPSQSDDPEKVVSREAVIEKAQSNPEAPPFVEVMAFNGSAPEVTNGRLAMFGFVAAVAAELNTGNSVLKQLTINPYGIAAAFGFLIFASLYPFAVGKKVSKVDGGLLTDVFNPTAEIYNGRAAMIGFAALLLTEWYKGGALF